MEFKYYNIEGPILILPKVFGDDRGFFFESFKNSLFLKNNIPVNFPQDNHSRSSKGVLRGLHFQIPPKEQGKLVRVIRGAVMDVIVDIRNNSPTYGKWISEELNEENKKILFVPPGFAHGFLTLEDRTDFLYKVTSEYEPEFEKGISPFSPELAIPWKDWLNSDFTMSAKDKDAPNLSSFRSPF